MQSSPSSASTKPASIPPDSSLNALLNDTNQALRYQVKRCLQAAVARGDLITRAEFDTQLELLAKTRLKLSELEKQLHELLACQSGMS